MGAAGFLIAFFLNVPYVNVMWAVFISGFLSLYPSVFADIIGFAFVLSFIRLRKAGFLKHGNSTKEALL